MNDIPDGPGTPGRDTLGLAVGLALVAGGLSLVAPFLVALVGALAALAVAGWVVGRRRGTVAGRPARRARSAAPIGILAVGGALFVAPPEALVPYRGLLLALTLVPLWWETRDGRGRPGGRRMGP